MSDSVSPAGPSEEPRGGDLKACASREQNAPQQPNMWMCLARLAYMLALATQAETMRTKMQKQEEFSPTTATRTPIHVRHLRTVHHQALAKQRPARTHTANVEKRIQVLDASLVQNTTHKTETNSKNTSTSDI